MKIKARIIRMTISRFRENGNYKKCRVATRTVCSVSRV